MRLKIVSIWDRGLANKERLDLLVVTPANLNYYAIFDTTLMGNSQIVAIPKRAYWFTAFQVSAGDHVVLYTGPGQTVTHPRSDGRKNHFFYWGLTSVIWSDPNSRAVLVELGTWETST